jgi:endonuclease G
MKINGLLLSLLFWALGLSSGQLYSQPDVWCLPSRECAADITLKHKGYVVSYDPGLKIPVWVAYYLVPERMQKNARRSNDFRPDPFIPLQFSATNADYKSSGYDRGHLAPAADMAWDTEVMSESFYFTNMTPQKPGFNRGIWKKLEDQVRQWAASYDTLLIVTGPVPANFKGYIGQGKVAVPGAFYKALVAVYHHTARGVAFVIPNESSRLPMEYYVLSVDSLESLLSCNLFAAMPEQWQEIAESRVDWEFWRLNPLLKTTAPNSGTQIKR